MKKPILIPIILIAPILASCKGMFVSIEQAKVIVENIKSKKSENIYEKFTLSNETKVRQSHSLMSKVIYDKNAKYYHSYEVNDNKITEIWYYAKVDSMGQYRFYNCSRYNGAVDERGHPVVNVRDSLYTDEQWLVVEEMVNDRLNSTLNNAILSIAALLSMSSNASLTLSSMNDYSLCVDGNVDSKNLEYMIDDCKITSIKTSTDKDNYEKLSCDYSRASVVYLNI